MQSAFWKLANFVYREGTAQADHHD